MKAVRPVKSKGEATVAVEDGVEEDGMEAALAACDAAVVIFFAAFAIGLHRPTCVVVVSVSASAVCGRVVGRVIGVRHSERDRRHSESGSESESDRGKRVTTMATGCG